MSGLGFALACSAIFRQKVAAASDSGYTRATDNNCMSTAATHLAEFRRLPGSAVEVGDRMLLAGHVLQAIECGSMLMHAEDYLEIATWAATELEKLDIKQLRSLSLRVPGPIQDIVEGLLHERGEVVWVPDAWALHLADAVWRTLIADI
jgi:hypothetical protein